MTTLFTRQKKSRNHLKLMGTVLTTIMLTTFTQPLLADISVNINSQPPKPVEFPILPGATTNPQEFEISSGVAVSGLKLTNKSGCTIIGFKITLLSDDKFDPKMSTTGDLKDTKIEVSNDGKTVTITGLNLEKDKEFWLRLPKGKYKAQALTDPNKKCGGCEQPGVKNVVKFEALEAELAPIDSIEVNPELCLEETTTTTTPTPTQTPIQEAPLLRLRFEQ
ncbi:MAG: hypothetical protein RM338_30380 [Nostoc sp. DedQUE12a]|nr:hypothetical protein [Nostoc sp. DedQUE12a]